jgi:hypothetical protein
VALHSVLVRQGVSRFSGVTCGYSFFLEILFRLYDCSIRVRKETSKRPVGVSGPVVRVLSKSLMR